MDLEVALKLTAEGDDLKAEVRAIKGDLGDLDEANERVGRSGRKAGKGLDEGGKGANRFRGQARRLNQQSKSLSSSLSGVARVAGTLAGVLGGISFGAMLADMGQTIYQAELLKGSLLSSVGGIPELADAAFLAIEQFASRTPFALDQSINAFIKMQNLGIRPTEERMMSFANTASAMGKDLNQMIEAVADASTMEFERLKEFGIKASQQGENVRFTFQGVTTEVGKNSEEIVQYLTNIGNVNFGDAAAAQMERLPGLLSNLKDNIDGIWRDLGDAGITEMLSSWVSAGIQWTAQMRQAINAGWFGWFDAQLQVQQERFSAWTNLFWEIWATFNERFSANESGILRAIDFIVQAVADLPINLEAYFKIVIANYGRFLATIQEKSQLVSNTVKTFWKELVGDDEAVAALRAERQAIQENANLRRQAAEDFIDDALAERQASIDARSAREAEAEAAAAAADQAYELALAKEEERASIDEVTAALEREEAAQAAAAEAKRKAADEVQKIREQLDPTLRITREYHEQVSALAGALQVGSLSQAEFNIMVAQLDDAAAEARAGLTQESDAIATMWTRGMERMDDINASIFKNLLRYGKASFDDLKDLFLDLLAEMAYAAARNKIVLSLGLGSLGSSAAASGASAASSGGNLLSGVATAYNTIKSGGVTGILNSLGSGLQEGLSIAFQDVGNFLYDIGFETAGQWATGYGADLLASSGAEFLQAGLTNLVVGYLGSLAGSAVGELLFDDKQANSDWGAAIGGTIGTILLPGIGTAIGAFLGSIADAAFGSSPSHASLGVTAGVVPSTKGRYVHDTATGASGLQFHAIARHTGKESVDIALQMLDSFVQLDQILTEATRAAGLTVDLAGVTLGGSHPDANKTRGVGFFGSSEYEDISKEQLENAPTEFVRDWILAVSADFDQELRTLVTGLQGDAQALTRDYVDALSLYGVFDQGGQIFTDIDSLAQTWTVLTEQFRRDGEQLVNTFMRLDLGLAVMDALGESTERTVENLTLAQTVFDNIGAEAIQSVLTTLSVVGTSVEDQFASLQEMAGRTSRDIYETQVEYNRELIAAYDGTAASAEALAQATIARREAELALLAELEAAYNSITARIGKFREELILDGLDTEGQYNRYRGQITDLSGQIATAGSAAELDYIMAELDRLGRSAYGLLDEDQQGTARQEFLDWLAEIEASAETRKDALAQDITDTSAAVDAETQSAIWRQAGLAGEDLGDAAVDLKAAAVEQKASAAAQGEVAGDLAGVVIKLDSLVIALTALVGALNAQEEEF